MIDELNARRWNSAASTSGETMNSGKNAIRSAVTIGNIEPGLAHCFAASKLASSSYVTEWIYTLRALNNRHHAVATIEREKTATWI